MVKRTSVRFLLGAALLALLLALARQGGGYETVSPQKADSLMTADTGIVILDVRTPSEYASETGHLERAVLLPVQELEQRLGELERYQGKTILAYCRSGVRSARASEILAQHGYRVLNLDGGILKWDDEKLPVIKEH